MNYQIESLTLIRSEIQGSRQLNNIFWAVAVTIGGLGFFLKGLSSFFQLNLLSPTNSIPLSFLPQGITLLFYGTVGISLGIFLWLTVWWDVGSGYNEYNKEAQKIILFRKGFPGKNRELYLTVNFDELKSIKMFIRDGINPQRKLYLCLKDNRQIPLNGKDQPTALNKIETEALKLAKFLNLYLETA